MKKLFLLFVTVAVATTFGALAPESLAGKIYHETGGWTPVRLRWESTIVLRTDGRYTFLKSARGSFVTAPEVGLLVPPGDGTYTYVRTGETTGRLTLNDPAGTLFDQATSTRVNSLSLDLTFADADSGDWDRPSGHGQFYLAAPLETRRLPLSNVSLRANVAPGQPAIAGFVVPGTGTKDSADLLIRVVGPSLAPFGVTGTWATPTFRLEPRVGPSFSSSSYARFDHWSVTPESTAAITKLAGAVGAFPLQAGSPETVAVLRAEPGAYTLVCEPAANDPGGEVLIEVYLLP